jgi:hypothetical protein
VAALVRHLQRYDFSSAKVTLLASAPGARDAAARFGHLGLRAALREEALLAAATELVAQCSSYGSLAFLPDFVASCSGAAAPAAAAVKTTSGKKRARAGGDAAAATAGGASGAQLAAAPPLLCLWPTAGAVRASARGWAGGADFPTKAETLRDALSRRLLHVFACPNALRATHERSLVHGKFLLSCRAVTIQIDDDDDDDGVTVAAAAVASSQPRQLLPGGAEVAWLVTGSHNATAAAWGGAVAGNGNCTAGNYELSVLFTPRLFIHGSCREAQWLAAGRLPPSRFTVALLPPADARGASGHGADASTAAAAAVMPRVVRFFPQFADAASAARGRARVVVAAGASGELLVPLPIPCRLPFATGGGAREALKEYAPSDVPFCGERGGWAGAEAQFALTDHAGRTHEQAQRRNHFAKR